MEWNVKFKLKREKNSEQYFKDDAWYEISHIKSEIITWLEDLDYEIDDLIITERKDK
jgi:hypothetical protein|tara:strand:- start:248 stop:418 length:171 start_codon:yes stop_codon:yes gene_type:complete